MAKRLKSNRRKYYFYVSSGYGLKSTARKNSGDIFYCLKESRMSTRKEIICKVDGRGTS